MPSSKDPESHRAECERWCQGKRLDPAGIDAIVASIAALLVLDPRSPEELIGYDGIGLPKP